MLPWVCSVIYHRGRQNVLKTSVTHSRAVREPLLCFFPHFDVICDLLLNRRTAIWNLFVKYKFFLTVKQSSFRERNLASPYRTLCLVPKVYLELWGIYHKSSNRPLPFSKVLEIDKPPPPTLRGGVDIGFTLIKLLQQVRKHSSKCSYLKNLEHQWPLFCLLAWS